MELSFDTFYFTFYTQTNPLNQSGIIEQFFAIRKI
jgi:hypothetical protein